MVISEGSLLVLTSTHESLIIFHYIFYIAPCPHTCQTNIHTSAVAGATICQQSRKKSCERGITSLCSPKINPVQGANLGHLLPSLQIIRDLSKMETEQTDTLVVKFMSITWAPHRHCVRHKVWQHCEILHLLQEARHCYNIGCLHKPGIN